MAPLTTLQSFGYLADDTVPVLERVLRSPNLPDRDREVLERARALFSTLAAREVLIVGTTIGRMSGDESELDALHVFEIERANRTTADYAAAYHSVVADAYETARGTADEKLADPRAL